MVLQSNKFLLRNITVSDCLSCMVVCYLYYKLCISNIISIEYKLILCKN